MVWRKEQETAASMVSVISPLLRLASLHITFCTWARHVFGDVIDRPRVFLSLIEIHAAA